MIIVMEMSSGRTCGEVFSCDGEACDERLTAGGPGVPRIEARLEEVVASAQTDMSGFRASLYATWPAE